MKTRINNINDDSSILGFADMIAALFAIFILAYILNIVINQIERENRNQAGLKDTYIITENFLFDRGSADITVSGEKLLKTLAIDSIIQNTKFSQDSTILLVQGFTDDTPIRTLKFPSNWELSTQRAVNVVKILIEKGNPTTHSS